MDPLAQLAVVGFPFLLGVVAYYVKRAQDETKANFDRLDASRTQVQKDFSAAFAKETSARLVDVANMARELERLEGTVLGLQREVDKEYVNFERLESVIRPLQASFEALRNDLMEGQREMFRRLDGKQDKQDRRERDSHG